MPTWLTIILGSAGFWCFAQFVILRILDLLGLKKQMKALELSCCRNELLMLMSNYPGEKQEILLLAQHYFIDLGGNYYLDTLFENWLEENKVKSPRWFVPKPVKQEDAV